MIKIVLAKLLTAKFAVAAVAAAAVTAGGVAAVAATGNLPGSPDGHAPAAPAASTTVHGSSTATNESSHGEAKNTGTPSKESPSPSLVGLCHAYSAGAGSEHGKALESPAFSVLITTAGGKDKVDAYCTKVLAEADHDPAGAATPPSNANGHATQPHPTEGQGDAHKTVPTVTKPSHP